MDDRSEINNPAMVFTVNCSGWVMHIWSSAKADPTQRENVDQMCAEDNRREYSIPDMFSKVIHVR